jgi:hypothetical protein
LSKGHQQRERHEEAEAAINRAHLVAARRREFENAELGRHEGGLGDRADAHYGESGDGNQDRKVLHGTQPHRT